MDQKRKYLIAGIFCGVLMILCGCIFFEIPQRIRNKDKITVGVFSDSYWEVQNGYSYQILNDAIQKFEKKHPEVEVVYESGILKEDYSEWLSEKIIFRKAPDVFMVLPEDFNDLVEVGAVKELSSFVESDQEFKEEAFYPSAYQAGKYHEGQYSMPYECAPQLMFVNKTILDKEKISVPEENWTWEDFFDICKKVTKDTDGNDSLDQYGVIGYTWKEAFDSNAVNLFNQDGTECNFIGDNVSEAISFIERLQNLSGDYIPTSRDFDMGNIAFQPMSFAEYRAYKSYPLSVKKYSGFEWECISMPAGPRGDNVSRLDTLLLAMNKDTKQQEYAWEFMKMLTYDTEIQSEIFEYSEGVSVLREVTESDQTLNRLIESAGNKSLNLHILTEVVESAVTIPKFRDVDLAIAEVDKAVNAIVDGDGNISMEQIIWNRALNKYLCK